MKRIVYLLFAFIVASGLFTHGPGIAIARAEQPDRADRYDRADRGFRNDRDFRRFEAPAYRADQYDRTDRDNRDYRDFRNARDFRRYETPISSVNNDSQKPKSPKSCPKCGSRDIGVNYVGWKWCKKCGTVIERP